jgi:hypothetical protein
MRKINWDDAADREYALKCLSKPWKVKFNHIYCLASLVAGLNHYHDFIGVYVVDAVLEDIRVGLEVWCTAPANVSTVLGWYLCNRPF